MILVKKKLLLLLIIAGPLTAAAQQDSSAFYLQKGIGKEQAKEWEAALSFFQKAVNQNPANADAQVALGRTAAQLKKFDLAASAMEKGLALKKQELGAGAGFATFHVSAGDFDEVLAYADKAGLLQMNGSTKYIQGKVHTITSGDTSAHLAGDSLAGAAVTINRSAEAANIPDAEIAYRIGKVFLNKQQYRAAAPFLEQAALIDSTRAERIYECALNFAAIPDPQSAIKYYLLAEKRGYQTDTVFYENLSSAYKAAGKTAEYEALRKKHSASL